MSAVLEVQDVERRVRALVNEVKDPCGLALGVEIGLDDMGLVRNVGVRPDGTTWRIDLRLRVTAPGCLYSVYFEREIRGRVEAMGDVVLDVTFDNVIDWTPDDMSASARRTLSAYRTRVLAAASRKEPA